MISKNFKLGLACSLISLVGLSYIIALCQINILYVQNQNHFLKI